MVLVYSCSGSSNVAQLANDIAVRLDRLGLAEMSSVVGVGGDVEPLVRKATSGRPVIAIDGCPFACSKRVLEAKGVRPTRLIRLHELGLRKEQHSEFSDEQREAVFAQVLSRLEPVLRRGASQTSLRGRGGGGDLSLVASRKTAPPPPPAAAPRLKQANSIDDYLQTIHFLASSVGEYGPVAGDSPALAAHVSKMLHVSRASAGEMLKRLEGVGLIERGARKEILLTPAGRAAAERAIRRHRLIERFLTDFVGYSPADSHEQADLLRDAFDDEMIERMRRRLGEPDRCPHGWPVDPAVEEVENRELTSLPDLRPGARATIVRLAEHDGSLLRWFYEEGLTPGTEVELRSADPATGQLTVRVEARERAISEKAAAGLFVRSA